MYRLVIMSQAQKDAKKISASGLKPKAAKLLEMIQHDPFCYPPAYEYLKGDLKGLISRRINKQHRLGCIACGLIMGNKSPSVAFVRYANNNANG